MSARNFACALSITVALGLPGVAAADYPEHSIRFEVGQAPGGSTDVVARLVARQIGEILGEPVIVENRTGNSGSIAADFVAKSKPDGYTMLVVSSSYSINPSLSNLPFDPKKDLAPVSLLAEAPFLLVVRPDFSAHNVDELLKLADAKHGALTYGSGGNGSSGHLAGALLSQLSRHEFTHVPYKGAGPALTDVIGGHIDFLFASVLSSSPFVHQGQLRALAVSGAKRSAALPSVPTVAESGVPGYSATTWYAILAPAGTPEPIVNRMSAAARTAMHAPAVVDVLRSDGAEPMGSTAAEFKSFLATQIDKWSALVKRFGIRSE
ncbi:MAG TPA: tripartite tricarboxylate transporter substrate binding protein [Casimicrobiaceae bacterium]|nr:tripartite tricarboxylate transporter substrate binding protein [Casimicrobiaceae bacterium]